MVGKVSLSLHVNPLPCPLQSGNICPSMLFVLSLAGSCGCLVMILFASEVKIHHLSEKIANYKEGTYAYKTQSEKYTTSFWVVFICFFVHFLNGLLIRLAGFQFPFAKSKDTETTNVAADLMYWKAYTSVILTVRQETSSGHLAVVNFAQPFICTD